MRSFIGGARSSEYIDLDSGLFDVDKYFRETINQPFSELLKLHNKIKTEVTTLDEKLQKLVYENYNKFISATETIRNMQDHMLRMEEEINQLSKNMTQIEELESKISLKLKPNREKVEKLVGTHRLMKRLQFLYELQGRLNECLEINDLKNAVTYWLKVSKVLERHVHLASFQRILTECKQLMNIVQQRLFERLGVEKHSETLSLLISLDNNFEEISKIWIKKRIEYLKTCTSDSSKFIKEYLSFLEITLKYLPGEIIKLNDSTMEAFRAFFSKITKSLTSKTITLENVRIELENIHKQIINHSDQLQDVLEEYLMVSSSIIAYHIAEMFENISIKKIILNLNFEKLLKKIKKITQLMSPLFGIKYEKEKFEKNESKFLNSLNTKVILQQNLYNLFIKIIEQLYSYLPEIPDIHGVSLPREKVNECNDFLSLSLFSHSLTKTGILQIISEIVWLMGEDGIKIISLINLGDREKILEDLEKFGPFFKLNEIMNSMNKVSSLLINHYTHIEGQKISRMVQKSIETPEWVRMRTPRSIRPAISMIAQEIKEVSKKVSLVFQPTRTHRKTSSRNSWSAFLERSMKSQSLRKIESNLERLFERRLRVYEIVEFNYGSIMKGIIQNVMRTLVESIRQCTFGTNGFNQIQVDCCFLSSKLVNMIEETILFFMLDEAISAAALRCIKPVYLTQSQVETICISGASEL